MDELRPDEIAARVLAWQHRDPLARRVRAAQVQSFGVVALPFAAAAGEGTGDPAAAAPAFSEDFIAPLAPARVARFAAQHAVAGLPPSPATPLREVACDPLPAGQAVHHRYLLTAAIEADGLRTRVLIGPAPGAPVLGRRLPDRRRQGLAAASVTLAGLAMTAVAWTAWPGPGPVPGQAVAAAPPAAVSSALPGRGASASFTAASASVAASAAWADPAAAAVPATAAAVVAGTPAAEPEAPGFERPLDVEPRWGTVTLPPRPQVVKPLPRRRQAQGAAPKQAGAVAAAAAGATAASAAAPRPATALPPPGQVWAVSTRLVRTRAESEQMAHAMRALVGSGGEVQVETVAVGDDWRVAAWPFLRRRDAERAQAVLAARGMRAVVVAF